ncbi:MAG: malonate decarboxylase acyl carrier protein [Rhodocyclaceae bacterium]|nr:malonate decarboxylase acyl carrier protein [Rhodocyclaceae bacterium]
MEQLTFELASTGQPLKREPVLVGVVGSGNCEVLIEGAGEAGSCRFTIHTSAVGFSPIWQAVLTDFSERRAAGGLRIEVNDVGATPAVVSLRLDQALEAWEAREGAGDAP